MARCVRMYETEQQGQDAVSKLEAIGVGSNMFVVLNPDFGNEESTVRSAVADGRLPGGLGNAVTQALKKGRTIVSTELPYGAGQRVEDILDSCGPVDTDSLPEVMPSNPAPFSDFFGIPTLARSRSTTRLSKGPQSRSFGLALLSSNPAPLSSIFKLPMKSKRPKHASFGLPLLSKKLSPLAPKRLPRT